MEGEPRVEVTSSEGLWEWLADHHSGGSVWLVTRKAAQREKYVSRDEVLDALVAYGWVDGRRMVLDKDRTMQLIAPRAAQVWARSYKARAERLIDDERMQPPGLAALRAAKASGLWEASDPIDNLIVPEDLRRALDGLGASIWFDAAAPSYRRNVLRYLSEAKRAATRAKRVALIADHASRGEKVPHY